MKHILTWLFACSCAGSVLAQQTIRLSDLNKKHWRTEYGAACVGSSATGEQAVVAGQSYTDVIGVHAPSSLKVALHKKALRFKARVALAETRTDFSDPSLAVQPLVDGTKLYFRTTGDTKQFLGVSNRNGGVDKGSVCFVLKADGKEIFRSPVVRAGAPVAIDVDLAGAGLLEMLAEPTADGPSGDNALWIEPVITYEGRAPESVAPETAGQGPEMSASTVAALKGKLDKLPVYGSLVSERTPYDWLLTPEKSKAGIYASADGKSLVVANGMVARTFRLFPNLATTGYTNRMTGESMLRAVSSEGDVWIDGQRLSIGGLAGQPERAYLLESWLDQLTTLPGSFLLEDFEVTEQTPLIQWKPTRWALNEKMPTGQKVVFTLRGEGLYRDVVLKLHVGVYDQVPVISKYFEIENRSALPLTVDSFRVEHLAMVEAESPSDGDATRFRLPNIHVESDYACAGAFTERETDITERWVTDPAYTSQRNYLLQTPCVLDVMPPVGPDQRIAAGGKFSSFRVYEMPFDSDDRERKGLFTRRMYRTLSPWTTQNPIFMHLTSTNPEIVKRAINQCDTTGYEMIILSFGSGLNAEDTSAVNIAKFKELVDYARSRGVEMGCYSLLASRWISDEVDVINPLTGKRGGMRFGSSPCLSSEWGEAYFRKIKTFFEKTGMRCFEHDGSYPGDVCASTVHAHHRGLNDSQWNQFHRIADLYHWMCENGIYLNVPDFYFLNGSTKVGIGYRETNWSLPRDRQLIHTRQLNYDCTWERPQSALWSFVPLVQYHGGGAAATLEPLSEHLYEYKTLMVQNYGAGVQACYRGPRLYDTPATRQAVVDVINWYKRYRRILNSDIIHLRRPDVADWDGIMHVDPAGKERALALFFNPTAQPIVREIVLPLYYTGLDKKARIREQEGKARSYKLDGSRSVKLCVTIPANGYTWYVVE